MAPRKSSASIKEIERRPVSKYAEVRDTALTQRPQNGRPHLLVDAVVFILESGIEPQLEKCSLHVIELRKCRIQSSNAKSVVPLGTAFTRLSFTARF